MKFSRKPFDFLPEKPVHILHRRTSRKNAQLLLNLVFALTVLVIASTIIFQVIMQYEGRTESWVTGFYWTLTMITTLGLGDITFYSDLGRLYSMAILGTGMIFFLVLIPFAVIQLFQSSARAPRQLAPNINNHVIVSFRGAVIKSLVQKFENYNVVYVIIEPDLQTCLDLLDEGYRVVHGDMDNPETYKNLRINHAKMVVSTASDFVNTSVIYAVRAVNKDVPIISTSRMADADHILNLAGATRVFQLDKMLGNSLARRIIGGDATAHEIGEIDGIVIAEASISGTPIVGKTLKEIKLPSMVGATVVGIWRCGHFEDALPDTRIDEQTTLVIAGSSDQISKYNHLFCIYNAITNPVVIIGAGNVGSTLSAALKEREVEHVIIEKAIIPEHLKALTIHGDAMNREILLKAGIESAPAVAITSHEDSINLYLTTLIRNMNPRIQIISRATHERTIALLHQAGSNFVMSYASLGANSIFNYLQSGNILMVAEGVDVFKVKTPTALKDKKIIDTTIRKDTGCSIVGINDGQNVIINPAPETVLKKNAEMILIGTSESEAAFFDHFNISAKRKPQYDY